MPDEYVAPKCEMEDCARFAQFELHAAWTIFDWLDAQACEEHVVPIWNILSRRLVDGEPPLEVKTYRYGDV